MTLGAHFHAKPRPPRVFRSHSLKIAEGTITDKNLLVGGLFLERSKHLAKLFRFFYSKNLVIPLLLNQTDENFRITSLIHLFFTERWFSTQKNGPQLKKKKEKRREEEKTKTNTKRKRKWKRVKEKENEQKQIEKKMILWSKENFSPLKWIFSKLNKEKKK